MWDVMLAVIDIELIKSVREQQNYMDVFVHDAIQY